MRKRLAGVLILCWIAYTCGSCSSAEPQLVIERPIWNKGDSWKVKVPVLSVFHNYEYVSGYYTLLVEVVDNEKVRGQDCHVLKVSTGLDYAQTAPSDERYESFVHYSTKDLTIKRIKTHKWQKGRLTTFDEHAEAGHTVFGLEIRLPTMPIVLPEFPIEAGVAKERFHKEFKRPKCKDQDLENDNRITSRTIKVLGQPTTVERAGQPALRGLKVKFLGAAVYTKSGARQYVALEQVWVPGAKWWSSARYGLHTGRSVAEYLLVREEVGDDDASGSHGGQSNK